MSDLISKQKTIDQLLADNDGIEREDAKAVMVCLEDVLEVIDEIPIAEQKTKCVAQIRINRDDIEDLVNEKVNEIVETMSEPKTGEWVKVIDEETPNVTKWHYECDQCGAGRWEKGQRYCQNCGARMRGEEA